MPIVRFKKTLGNLELLSAGETACTLQPITVAIEQKLIRTCSLTGKTKAQTEENHTEHNEFMHCPEERFHEGDKT